MDEVTFKDGVVICQSIPGSTAMQTAAYVGLRTRNIFGAFVSYLGFGLPAFVLMLSLVLAGLYFLKRSGYEKGGRLFWAFRNILTST